ncbi:MAG: hypothetical protein ACRYF0_09420 [Janthinobacterium lividum]
MNFTRPYQPALYLNLALILLLLVNLIQQERDANLTYGLLSVLFNPFCALLALGMGKWRTTLWFGGWFFLSIGVVNMANYFIPPPHSY